MMTRFLSLTFLVFFCLTALAGCAQNIAMRSQSASLVEFIEPVKDSRKISQKTPLVLPVSVAVIMVPGKPSDRNLIPNTTLRLAAEKLKQQLLANPKYINSVAVVTGDDIKNKISLDRIRAIYAADIAILISYQQDQRSIQSGPAGLMDVTIIGAFLFPGVVTKTASVVDGKIVHIPSNAIIFMQNGMDERSATSTSYAQTSFAREESINSILAATTNFGNSLSKSLAKFDNYDISQAASILDQTELNSAGGEKDKSANDYWAKVDTYKSTGGGAWGLVELLLCVAVCFASWRRT